MEYWEMDNYLKERFDNDSGSPDYDKLVETSLWELEERMGADHFATHSSPGFRAGHIPLMPIRAEEAKAIVKNLCS